MTSQLGDWPEENPQGSDCESRRTRHHPGIETHNKNALISFSSFRDPNAGEKTLKRSEHDSSRSAIEQYHQKDKSV